MIYLALTLIPTKLGNMSGLLLLSDTHLEQICVWYVNQLGVFRVAITERGNTGSVLDVIRTLKNALVWYS